MINFNNLVIKIDWYTDGENAGKPIWKATFGDYKLIVNCTFDKDRTWIYRVDNQGEVGFATAEKAKEKAEFELKRRLEIRIKKANETFAIFEPMTTTTAKRIPPRYQAIAVAVEYVDRNMGTIRAAVAMRAAEERKKREDDKT